MSAITIPAVKIKDRDYDILIRLKPKLEIERGQFISMAELVREALRELAKINGIKA